VEYANTYRNRDTDSHAVADAITDAAAAATAGA
jgi:hypothetical protein